jgi:DNA-binding transcriptional MerR regulator
MSDYRVDDLARAAGTTTRNVRVYAERGLLPPPRLDGRVGWYDDGHLARLRLIGRLLERGFTLANIGELLSSWENGRDLAEVLGVEQALTLPWNDEPSTPVTLAQLRSVLGRDLGAAEVDRFVAIGLLRRSGRRFVLPSPDLLAVAGELVALGLPLPRVLDLAEAMVANLRTIAVEFIETTAAALRPELEAAMAAGDEAEFVVKLARRLRPLAAAAVSRGFSVTMDRAAADLLSGRLVDLAEENRYDR